MGSCLSIGGGEVVLVGTADNPDGNEVGRLVNTDTVGTLVGRPVVGALDGCPVGRELGAEEEG